MSHSCSHVGNKFENKNSFFMPRERISREKRRVKGRLAAILKKVSAFDSRETPIKVSHDNYLPNFDQLRNQLGTNWSKLSRWLSLEIMDIRTALKSSMDGVYQSSTDCLFIRAPRTTPVRSSTGDFFIRAPRTTLFRVPWTVYFRILV